MLTIYTTPTCPDCRALKAWLDHQGVSYQERDLSDQAVMEEAKARYGVRVAPITVLGDWFTYGTFQKQQPEIRAILQKEGLIASHGRPTFEGQQVSLPQVEQAIDVASGQTILNAALEQGIPYPHCCRSGRCGKCKSRLISGEVSLLEHTGFALSDQEKAEGMILACCALPNGPATVEWLGAQHELPDHPLRRLQCRVSAIDHMTHDICRLRLALDGQMFRFSAGQHAQLSLPGVPARDYSMANRPDMGELEFHIRRVPDGQTSSFIHSNLKVGDPLTLEGPFGTSYLRHEHSGPILAVAGGSGLAPILSIVETALERGMRQPIHIYFGVRAERDLYLLEHFRSLAHLHEHLTFTPVLSDQGASDYRTGMVSAAVAKDLDNLEDWKAYVAGPPAMVKATTIVLANAGLQSRNLHADIFFSPEQSSRASTPEKGNEHEYR
ncbi:oxidoreductase [Pelagibacterium lentulum]|uniref:Oxidoreductase n=2 Tax=Pelagibacterium lentulum TaxID=2029865 RepID=A0A916VYN4_9HYPH|nr:oxidoreductase [Pelagibacterium lentulum]